MTGNFVPLTFSKIRMGNRLSCSSLATRAVISKRGSTSLLMVKTSSGDSCLTFSIKLRRSVKLDFASDTIFLVDKFAVLAAGIDILSSLDDFRALFVQELVAAIGAEQLDLLAPKFLVVTIELAFALRAGHPENFRHGCVPRIFSRQGAKFSDQADPEIPVYLGVFASLRDSSLFL